MGDVNVLLRVERALGRRYVIRIRILGTGPMDFRARSKLLIEECAAGRRVSRASPGLADDRETAQARSD
jgi:hypothetical protein